MRVVGYAPDLIDGSKLRAAGVELVRAPAELAAAAGNADLVVVDLSRPGVMETIGRIDARVVGFGPHVDEDLLAAGEAAGCAEVLPRSRFFRRLRELTSE